MKIEDMQMEIRLRPRRIQEAADRAAESLLANLERVMDLSHEDREQYAAALRDLARGRHGTR